MLAQDGGTGIIYDVSHDALHLEGCRGHRSSVIIFRTRGGPCQHVVMCGCKQWSNDINESNYNMQPITIIQFAVRVGAYVRTNRPTLRCPLHGYIMGDVWVVIYVKYST